MKVTVCIGSACHLKGARDVIEKLQELSRQNHLDGRVDFAGSFCSGNCVDGVCVTVDETLFTVKPEETRQFFDREILGRLCP